MATSALKQGLSKQNPVYLYSNKMNVSKLSCYPYLLHRCFSSERKENEPKATSSDWPTAQQRVFSGIQPTGVPHLGNYAGAISPWVRLQRRFAGQMLVSVVDLHSLTAGQNPSTLRKNILDMTACLLACGIDPEKTIIFQQSMVPQHTELCWLLSCLCSVPRLQRLATWKDKKKQVKEPSVGLLTYPILQAADILLYKATHVPVGEDQAIHIDLTLDLARIFNGRYRPIFPRPHMLAGEVTKLRSLRDPSKKMSKSDPMARSRIDLTDPPEVIREVIKKAVTDFTSQVSYDPASRPGVSNLVDMHSAVTGLTHDEVVEESFLLFEDTGQYKLRLARVLAEHIEPIRQKILVYQKSPDFLLQVLHHGADRASTIASQTLEEVREAAGLR